MDTYLYNRVSSSKQNRSNKDGLTRQKESPEVISFLKKHNLSIVKTMEYIGSSFKGKNFDNETVLGRFVTEIKKGNIKTPICLCFENWDRFGRDIEWKNTKRFLDLIDCGVSIGVVQMDIVIDQKVLSENSNILQIVVNDIQRARKESERKSSFSKRNLSIKVEKAKNGDRIYFGGQSPRWIQGVKNSEFVLDNDMVSEIKRIFDLYIDGKSCVAIAKILNKENKTTFGVSKKQTSDKKSKNYWFNTTIRNVLTNKSLLGYCKINDFESNNYYPEIIPPSQFLKAQIKINKNATKRGGSVLGNIPNIFQGIIFCGNCGNDIGARMVTQKNKTYNYMQCRKSQVHICDDKTIWKMNEFEQFVFAFVIEKIPTELFNVENKKENDQQSKLKLELNKVELSISKTIKLIDSFPEISELESKLRDLTNTKKSIKEKLSIIEIEDLRLNESGNVLNSFKNTLELNDDYLLNESCKKLVSQLEEKETREKLRNIIPDIIKRITCNLSKWNASIELYNGNVVKLDFSE